MPANRIHLEPNEQGWKVHFVAEPGFAKKTLPVAALAFGPLLVHLSAPGDKDIPAWTISHEATGGRILAAHSLEQAEHLALALTQDFAWDFRTLLEFKARKVEIRDAIQAALKNSGETWKFNGNTFSVEPPKSLHAR